MSLSRPVIPAPARRQLGPLVNRYVRSTNRHMTVQD